MPEDTEDTTPQEAVPSVDSDKLGPKDPPHPDARKTKDGGENDGDDKP